MPRIVTKLNWPAYWKRTTRRHSTTLGRRRTVEDLVTFICDEAAQFARPAYGRRLDIKSLIVTYNLRAAASDDFREDHGAAVYFTFDRRQTVLACDRWMSVHSNLAAIGSHLRALRGIARWGVGSLKQAFQGYMALPPAKVRPADAHAELPDDTDDLEDDWDEPIVTPDVDWRAILDLGPGATLEDARDSYRSKMTRAHPDNGGSHDAATRLNDAWSAARNFFRRR